MRTHIASTTLVVLLATVALSGVVAQSDEDAAEEALRIAMEEVADGFWKVPLRVAFGGFAYGYEEYAGSVARYFEDLFTRAVVGSPKVGLVAGSEWSSVDGEFRERFPEAFDMSMVEQIVSGRYFDRGDAVELRFVVETVLTSPSETIGEGMIRIPVTAIPPGLGLLPANPEVAGRVEEAIERIVPEERRGGLDIGVSTNRGDGGAFYDGEDLVVVVSVNRDCYVKLYHIDVNGRMQVIFPNRFDSDNFLSAGESHRIGDDSYPFRFRLHAPFGVEHIKAVASTEQFAEIEEDFASVGVATRSLLARGMSVVAPEAEQAEAEVRYTIAPAP